MKIVDLNVILYAINRSSPRHEQARAWWEMALAGPEPVGLPWVVVLGFLRLSTRSSIFPMPLSVEDACAYVTRWLSKPNVRLVVETEEHWLHLQRLLLQRGTGGNLTTDAHIAALTVCYGGTLVSFDHDFSRFPGLRWTQPVTPMS